MKIKFYLAVLAMFFVIKNSYGQLPGANFTPGNTTICSGDTLVFTSTSSNVSGTTNYAWDFDYTSIGGATIITPGGIGNQFNGLGPVSVSYSNSGTAPLLFTVYLLVANGFPPTIGLDADTISVFITVLPAPPIPIFLLTTQNSCAGLMDTVTLLNPTNGVTYSLNITNGGTLIGQASPVGPFYVQLPPISINCNISITASIGTCTKTSPNQLVVVSSCAGPTAAFALFNSAGTFPTNVCAGTTYYMTDISFAGSAPIVSWTWNFDLYSPLSPITPQTAVGPGPHAIISPTSGLYYASLTLVDANGFVDVDTMLYTMNPPCNGPLPLTAIIYPSVSPNIYGCLGDSVQFTDNSFGGTANYSWTWIWGDASPNVLGPNGIHTYASAGTYTLMMILSDSNLTTSAVLKDTAYQTVVITAPPLPIVSNNDTICLGANINIGGAPLAGVTYFWFPSSGLNNPTISNPVANPTTTTTYYAVVTHNASTCVTSDSVVITVETVPNFAITGPASGAGCTNSPITFSCTNNPLITSYFWGYGVGNLLSGSFSSPGPNTVSWPLPNTYSVSLTGTTQSGCPLVANPFILSVVSCNAPNANFIMTDDSVCTGSLFPLFDATSASPLLWSWNFGIGASPATSNAQNPTVTYSTTGYHVISLTASNAGGTTSYTDSVYVKATPSSSFNIITPVCVGVNTFASYTGSAPSNAIYNWSFGGGFSPTGANTQGPEQANWLTPGIKISSLQVIQDGCYSNISANNVTVIANPVANYNFTVNNGTVSFNSTSSGVNNQTTYIWTFGDATPSSNLKNPIHTYALSGSYEACLTVINDPCSDEFCDTIDVVITGGLDEVNSINPEMLLAYNEFTKLLSINLNNNEAKNNLSIYDINGKLLFNTTTLNAITEVDTNLWSAGVYIIKANTNKISSTKKWTKL